MNDAVGAYGMSARCHLPSPRACCPHNVVEAHAFDGLVHVGSQPRTQSSTHPPPPTQSTPIRGLSESPTLVSTPRTELRCRFELGRRGTMRAEEGAAGRVHLCDQTCPMP